LSLRAYEVLYIVDPDVQDADVEKLIERFNKVVTGNGGEVQKSEIWQRRKLAYEIKGRREGVYCIMQIQAPPDVPKELSRQLGIAEPVLRSRVYAREPAGEKDKT
jgi:small subunit ribosomal protein S6